MSNPVNPPPYSAEPPPSYVHVAQGATVIQMQPVMQGNVVVVAGKPMGPEPVTMVCQSCHCTMITKIDPHPTIRTHMWALCLFLFGCWPCMCVPYCMPSCMNVNHYCPNCNAYIGNYRG